MGWDEHKNILGMKKSSTKTNLLGGKEKKENKLLFDGKQDFYFYCK